MGIADINATVGIDLGKERDHTAFVTVERLQRFFGPTDANSMQDNVRGLESVWVVRRAQLFALGTSYTDVVEAWAQLVHEPILREARTVIDASGVGVGVMEMFRERYRRDLQVRHRPRALTITGGQEVNGWNVPKLALISNLIRITQEGRLVIPEDLPLADKLRQEMRDFTFKYSKAGNLSAEADKESQHDDLLMALSYAVFREHRNVTPHGLYPDGTTVDRWIEDVA